MSVSIGFNIRRNAVEIEPKAIIKFQSPTFGLSDQEFVGVVLDYIYDTTNIRIGSITELSKFSSLNGLPFIIPIFEINSVYPTYTLAFGIVRGSLVISSEDKVDSLGNIEEIHGDLILKGSSLQSLGRLKKIIGSLYIRQFDPPFSSLTTLGELEFVGRDLILKNSPVRNLGKLTRVGGKLNLRRTPIESLTPLSFVGGDLFLPKSLKNIDHDTRLVTVGGNIKYFSN